MMFLKVKERMLVLGAIRARLVMDVSRLFANGN
jgi:hypothetical protein